MARYVLRRSLFTLGFFFFPAPDTFVCRDGFGRNIEDPPFLPFKQGWVALAMLLTPQLSTKVPEGVDCLQGVVEAGANRRSISQGETAAI